MTPAPSASAEAAPDDAPSAVEDFARAVLEEQMAGLRRLAQIGIAISEDIGRMTAAAAAASETGSPETAETVAIKTAAIDLAFFRVSRAVRLTYAMQIQVVEQLRRVGHIEEANARGAEREREALDLARRATAAGVLTRIIGDEDFTAGPKGSDAETDAGSDADEADGDLSEAGDRELRERLVAEASECLRDRDRFGDLTKRPVSDVIAEICRELGLSPDWFSLSEEAWAQQEVRSGLVGAALASLPPKSVWPPRRPRPIKPRPVRKPPSAAKPPPAPAPPEPTPETPDDSEFSRPIETRPPPTPAPPPEPSTADWPPWEDEDTIARRHALPGELPPPRRPRPRGRPPTY